MKNKGTNLERLEPIMFDIMKDGGSFTVDQLMSILELRLKYKVSRHTVADLMRAMRKKPWSMLLRATNGEGETRWYLEPQT